MNSFLRFMQINILVWTLQCTDNQILYLFCQRKYEKAPSNLRYFSKIPAIFSTDLTVQKQQKYKIYLSFYSTYLGYITLVGLRKWSIHAVSSHYRYLSNDSLDFGRPQASLSLPGTWTSLDLDRRLLTNLTFICPSKYCVETNSISISYWMLISKYKIRILKQDLGG